MRIVRLICVLLGLVAGLCFAGPDSSPDLVFKDLDGVERRPLELDGKIASVLIFYWQDCPICNSYAPELNRLGAAHTNVAFYIVQVDPDLTVAAAKQHAQKFDLCAPVLLDPRHRLVKFARAAVTPEVVVFGKAGDVLYRGRIDDGYVVLGKKRMTITAHDLSAALDAIAAGQPVKISQTKPVGCLIQ